MAMYGKRVGSQKSHSSREGNPSSTALQRTALYPAAYRKRDDKDKALSGQHNESPAYQRNFSQVPLLKAAQLVSMQPMQAFSKRLLFHQASTPANVPNHAQSNQRSVIQCKPGNIKQKHSLKLNKEGTIQNGEAERVDPPVSYPMNTLIALHLITHDDLKGGHLFKREYGGEDNYSNVVTWSERSEAAYTNFEEKYLAKAREGAIAANKTVTYKVDTEATFGNANVTKTDLFGVAPAANKAETDARHKVWNLVRLSLETVPTSVKASFSGLPGIEPFARDGGKMLDSKVVPSATNAQTQVNNIVNGIADDRLERALERVKSP